MLAKGSNTKRRSANKKCHVLVTKRPEAQRLRDSCGVNAMSSLSLFSPRGIASMGAGSPMTKPRKPPGGPDCADLEGRSLQSDCHGSRSLPGFPLDGRCGRFAATAPPSGECDDGERLSLSRSALQPCSIRSLGSHKSLGKARFWSCTS